MKRFIILSLLILLLINAGDIGRFFFPIPYRQMIFREAAGAGLDAFLVAAIVKTESDFNAGAVSVKGARGLMQIMPETGKWVAGKKGLQGYNPDLLFNPEYNVRIGVWYVSELYREYRGDTVLVLAAYNAGRGNVGKWLEQHSWTGEQGSIDQIPFPETRQFIRKVLFYQKVYRHLYGSTPAGGKN
ncbi:MAG: lytic transglycosylase domain-containing protein [Peptococcaceae bacterium]|nr:lytic transglycosylase domain-containing protein [Peptococcaceae bacterium]